jgi:ornithine carbamoyltransferase
MTSHAPRHLLGLRDFPLGAGSAIFHQARQYKATRGHDHAPRPLHGQSWAMIFSKSSTRTRVSFEVGVRELGGAPIFLNASDIQLGRGEPIRDTARVLGRMVHGAIIRTYAQHDIEEFAAFSNIPTVNALSDDEHPCQILSDIFTYEEKRGPILGRKAAFIGDADCNVARSWAYAAAHFNFSLTFAAPKGYQCPVRNANVSHSASVEEAARNADLLYTDVWISMGKEDEAAARLEAFAGFQINHDLLEVAHKDCLVLHCLPAYRGKEISEALFEARARDLFDQAENRLHVQKAVLHWMAARQSSQVDLREPQRSYGHD